MKTSLIASTAVLFALLASPISAQSETTSSGAEAAEPAQGGDETTAGELSMGDPANPDEGVGSAYVDAVFDAWELRCIRSGTDTDPCQLYQLLVDAEGNSVAEISMFPIPEGQEAAAGATIITPLETLLTERVTLAIDGADSRTYPFTFCNPAGCFARVGFTQAEVDAFRRGSVATVQIVPAAAPDQVVAVEISLAGFTAGFKEVQERLAPAAN